jgi:hypothetical protein
MRLHFFAYPYLIVALLLAACAAPLDAREEVAGSALPYRPPRLPPKSCPITKPQDPVFIPPEPYAAKAPYGNFWYGTNRLWTMLEPDGTWSFLPQSENGFGQKVFLWREGYSMTTEPQPIITMSGRQIDGTAVYDEHTDGTNGYHPELGQFMLTGVTVPVPGCWEFTARYEKAELSFVVWVVP